MESIKKIFNCQLCLGSRKKENKTDETEWDIINREFILQCGLTPAYGYGLCLECHKPNTGNGWCQPCNVKRWKKDFDKWTSGNPEIDKFIQTHQLIATNRFGILEWIPYDQFTNIEFLAEGGFSKVYKTSWIDGSIKWWSFESNRWERWNNSEVVLKILNNSQDINAGFLQEMFYHQFLENSYVVKCYGISQDPESKNYIMVMEYMCGGNLRQCLNSKILFYDDLLWLQSIASGLNSIHQRGLLHRDFHPGNILNRWGAIPIGPIRGYVADFGLCRPANSQEDDNKIYGILPYVAPEVLQGKKYTQASDIYSFGIVAYEFFANILPYSELRVKGSVCDEELAVAICNGLRPNINRVKVPQLLKDLISQCWDADPLSRPAARELQEILSYWHFDILKCRDTAFYWQYKKIEKEYYSKNKYEENLQAESTSKQLDFEDLPELKNCKEINELFYNSKQNLEDLECLIISPNEVNIESQSIDLKIVSTEEIKQPNIQEDQEENSNQKTEIQIPPK